MKKFSTYNGLFMQFPNKSLANQLNNDNYIDLNEPQNNNFINSKNEELFTNSTNNCDTNTTHDSTQNNDQNKNNFSMNINKNDASKFNDNNDFVDNDYPANSSQDDEKSVYDPEFKNNYTNKKNHSATKNFNSHAEQLLECMKTHDKIIQNFIK